MPLVPIMHGDSAVRDVIRRGVRHRGMRVVSCRSWGRLDRLMPAHLIDAVIVDIRRSWTDRISAWAERFPYIPLFGLGSVRPDDGPLVADYYAAGVTDVLVLSVDGWVAGEVVAGRSLTAGVRRELVDAPGLLRLTEPLQQRVWDTVLGRVDQTLRTAALATALGMSREHLSREFAAGDAPNLKRVIDVARLVVAARLLANPGYNVGTVAGILGYATASHLATCAGRIAGIRPVELAGLGPRGVIGRFRQGRTRSRL